MTTLNEGKIFGQVGLRYFGHGKEGNPQRRDKKMKFKCSEAEIVRYRERMDKLELPYTIERDRKGSYMVTNLNEEEFYELVEDSCSALD